MVVVDVVVVVIRGRTKVTLTDICPSVIVGGVPSCSETFT